ncbi:MAG: hypothetical protein ACTSUI_07845, partial [Promethearchaeota archaeon]
MSENLYDQASQNSEMNIGNEVDFPERTDEIRVAIAGLGNCASALVMGKEYYKNVPIDAAFINGLMNPSVGGYTYRNIKFVAAFEINELKIGKDISEAMYEGPNVVQLIVPKEKMPKVGAKVYPGPILDGCAPHMIESFHCYNPDKIQTVDVAEILKEKKAEILVNFLPVGSFNASRAYAQAALDAGCGFINCIPEFIVSEHIKGDKDWV